MLPSGETAGEAGGGCKGFLRMSTAGQNSALLSQLGGGTCVRSSFCTSWCISGCFPDESSPTSRTLD